MRQASGRRLRVRVPASTSNVGTGFDCLGIALDLFLDVRVHVESGVPIEPRLAVRGPAAAAWPEASSNRLVHAFDVAAARLGLPAGSPRFEVETEIPVSRGLGSSGAATAAGLLLASALASPAPDPEWLLALGIELEGHPDNVTASLFGGCTLCVPSGAQDLGPQRIAIELHPDLAFALAWPEAPMETARARDVLPSEVPFAHAVENARRLPLLLEGLRTARVDLLRAGSQDCLHEIHRLPLVPGGKAALIAARAEGAHVAVLSGSGSALFAVASHERVGAVLAAMEAALRTASGRASGRIARAVHGAPLVREEP